MVLTRGVRSLVSFNCSKLYRLLLRCVSVAPCLRMALSREGHIGADLQPIERLWFRPSVSLALLVRLSEGASCGGWCYKEPDFLVLISQITSQMAVNLSHAIMR